MTLKQRRLMQIRRLVETRSEMEAVELRDADVLDAARRRAANAGAEWLGRVYQSRSFSVGAVVHRAFGALR